MNVTSKFQKDNSIICNYNILILTQVWLKLAKHLYSEQLNSTEFKGEKIGKSEEAYNPYNKQ